jgi:type I restriction enzyme R subunit
MAPNQNPEQEARDNIDFQLSRSGWTIQDRKKLNLSASTGVAVREYPTDTGPADYVLFVNGLPVGIIEAKPENQGGRLHVHEEQVQEYAQAQLKYISSSSIPFLYLSTGVITKFTDTRDVHPRYREVFTFHRPETLLKWYSQDASIRTRMHHNIPALDHTGLRDCQIDAITNLEKSFKDAKPRALVQMATGSGKTFTAITSVYRLLKHVKAERILFLVDTRNLGEQAEGEFRKYQPQDDNRLFPELYGVHRLTSSNVPQDSQVYISTIQRLYSILKGEEMDESAEEANPNELKSFAKEPLPVVYNERLPIEFFDFIVIDECHRSIYNLWRQVLDYFDAFQVGLTATPDNRTFGYFNQNVVSDYGYEKAVVDGVLVPYNVYTIETQITKDGNVIKMGETIDVRERLTRKKFWQTVDEDVEYTGRQLDRDVVNPSTIRSIIKEVKNSLPTMFPDRFDASGAFEVPKMLIFAKTDSHAEDIIDVVREEFAQGIEFCKKITYQSTEDPKTVLSQFRNNYYPRIAVTVDMIATGTDIRPLEVLLFMRDVKSKSYYEQMKGRGTRTCSVDELRSTGTPSAKYSKDHFVIIDAIGVEQSQKTDSRPLEKAPSVSLAEVLQRIAVGDRTEEMMSTLANRLLKLSKQISPYELDQFKELAGGKNVSEVVRQLLYAHDPDTKESIIESVHSQHGGTSQAQLDSLIQEQFSAVLNHAVAPFNDPELRTFLVDVRKKYDQIIDTVNIDTVITSGWVKDQVSDAQALVDEFKAWMLEHKDTITALQIFYNQPQRRKDVTFKMIKDLTEQILRTKPTLAPLKIWKAYEVLGTAQGKPKDELIALVSLVRNAAGIDDVLTSYDKKVNDNFANWVWKKQQGATIKFNQAQMDWLRMMKDHIAASVNLSVDDLDYTPFDSLGGRAKMYQLFKGNMEQIIEDLNEALVA